MNLMKIFGALRGALDRRAHMSLFGNVNTQARCKSDLTRPKAFESKKFKKTEEPIGLYGYCLLGVPIATFALGTWQIKRLRWKLNLIENLKQRTSAEPIDLPSDLNELKDKEYYRMKVTGKFLYEKEFLIGPRSLILDGEGVSEKGGGIFSRKAGTGYYVVTPFRLEDRDLTIMVNRGWIPRRDRSTFKMGNKITDPVEIVGIIRTTEKRPQFVPENVPAKEFGIIKTQGNGEQNVLRYIKNSNVYSRDLDAMAKVAEAEPVYIELLAEYGTPEGPIGGQTKVTLRNEHLSYIFTWYSLSLCTSYMWYRQFVQKLPLL